MFKFSLVFIRIGFPNKYTKITTCFCRHARHAVDVMLKESSIQDDDGGNERDDCKDFVFDVVCGGGV